MYNKEKRKEYIKAYRKKNLEKFREMIEKQSNKCAICCEYPKPGKKLVVDHSHSSGKIRGLLCNNCNNGLGHMKDNIEILEKAIKYLKKYVK